MFTSIAKGTNMSDRNFGRRRRGMRFRPSGGLGHGQQQKTDKEATQARAEAVGEVVGGVERVYEKRHQHEIERAENVAAGLPPEGAPAEAPTHEHSKKDFREPHLDTPAQVQEEKPFEPVKVANQSRSIVEKITD